ncbi:zinc finger MYM-type protein 3 isoform X2 [Belonocnema kinseyi]|nr:zinc finger MYM-type protein 3 isoform X2 [Belonocnema kinseyi]
MVFDQQILNCLIMNSKNETPLITGKVLLTGLQKCKAENENETNKVYSNVKNPQLNVDIGKNSQEATAWDTVTEVGNELSVQNEDQSNFQNIASHIEENIVSIPPDLSEQDTINKSEESNILENASTESHLDISDSLQVVDSGHTNKESKTSDFESYSVPETAGGVSKGLDVLPNVDVESPDSVLQQSRINAGEDLVSRTNVNEDFPSRLNADDDSASRMNVVNDSVLKMNVDEVDSNLCAEKSKNSNIADADQAKKESIDVPDGSVHDSPKPMEIHSRELGMSMDLININEDFKSNEVTAEIEKDVITNTASLGKSNKLSQEILECDKSPMVVDEITDAADKESSSGKISNERVNTEFVQITQDKQDDSQIESHSIEAEDPFGGDNLNTDNSEQMETEAISKNKANFEKLGSVADNLQDVVNAKKDQTAVNCEKEKSHLESSLKPNDTIVTTSSENNENSVDSLAVGVISEFEKADEKSSETFETKLAVAGDEKEKSNEKDKLKDKTILNVESEPSVLPGQDDELCIIPDSMKDLEVEKKDEIGTNESEKANNNSGDNKQIDSEKPNLAITVFKDAKEVTANAVASTEVSIEEITTIQHPVEIAQSITDVIDVEEDSEKSSEVEEISSTESCKQCNEVKNCKIKVKVGSELFSVCSKACKSAFKSANNKAMDIPSDGVNSKREKRCASCLLIIEPGDERCLSWETMEFCHEECLGKFQTKYGSYCRNCNGSVQAVSLGKYCVRFGYDVRQFCCSICLEEFKKGLKVCTYCQKDISAGTEGFLAPVGDKGQFKDFCTQDCMEKYSRMSSTEAPLVEKKACSVCQEEKIVHCEVQIDRAVPVAICSDPCFAAFKFVNKVDPDQCSTCKKFFELPNKKSFVVFYENDAHTFCTKTCLNIFIITNRKIVPCSWCKVKKYNFDMIKKELKTGQVMMMCSLNCLTLYQVSINAVSARRIKCDFCKEVSQAQYHLTMSDATIRNFCCYNCVMNFQSQYTKSPITIPSGDDHPVPTGVPKRTLPARAIAPTPPKAPDVQTKKIMPVISSVTSLASIGNGQVSPTSQPSTAGGTVVPPLTVQTVSSQTQIVYKQQIITRPPSPVNIHNRSTQCKPLVHTKGVSVRPHPCTKSTQTDEIQKTIIPIPVPIYVPFPIMMYNMPFPVPTPFPLPIPVPIFVPTTRNSAKDIMKDIKRIQEKMPSDPFEAELLMMAEMVATEKKTTESDSESVDENRDSPVEGHNNTHGDNYSPECVDSNNTFGEDMLQMALKMATGELDEPAVDLEAALTPNTITPSLVSSQAETHVENDVQPERPVSATRGRKRMVPYKPRATPSKRGRRASGINDMPLMPPPESQSAQQSRFNEPVEKPDANMALKYTFGVNAWRHWVVTKNAELEKQNTSTRKVKQFKTDLLQLTADELNYSLCLFVKEVRKPNGAEYAPDTIYYLCLGIQQYLFENNRIDNIFTDSYYEKFTDCLNEVAKKFSILYNDAQYIVTRVEEEHLWECKQLGAHSPHVLLSTLMFFNTKHFNLVTVEEHMQLSFSHIMKHWKRNPSAQPAAIAGKVPGSRNVLLRFYPPQSALEANSRKKKVYEQQENEENPLRCPVKLYEFYLSKCPESVKTRNDVFYLLPERSCVPDSPVWYSTSPLAKEHLVKMLYRIKMVKEINIALLNS